MQPSAPPGLPTQGGASFKAQPAGRLFEADEPLFVLVSNRPLEHWRASRHPRVSFMVLSYENARFLPATLESVSFQTWRDMEIIVGDDGSTDSSPELIRTWLSQEARPALAVLWRTNGGIVRNYNGALRWARGEFVAHIGSDDINEADRVEVQLLDLQNVGAAMSIGGMAVIDDRDRVLRAVAPQPERQQLDEVLRCGSVAATSPTMMYHRRLIDDFGLLPEQLANEDEALAFRALVSGGISVVSRSLVRYRVHGNSVTARNRQLRLTGYLAWLERNLPLQIENKKHWRDVLMTRNAPARLRAQAEGHTKVLLARLGLLLASRDLGALRRIVRLLSQSAGRQILRDYIAQALRALRLEYLQRRVRAAAPVGDGAS